MQKMYFTSAFFTKWDSRDCTLCFAGGEQDVLRSTECAGDLKSTIWPDVQAPRNNRVGMMALRYLQRVFT